MSKPKGTTLQQKFGFADSDLVKPSHDLIMMWLDENIVEVVSTLINYNDTWTNEAELRQKSNNEIKDEIGEVQATIANYSKNNDASNAESMAMGVASRIEWYNKLLSEQTDELDKLKRFVLGPVPQKPALADLDFEKVWEKTVSTKARNPFMVGFIDMQVRVLFQHLALEKSGKTREQWYIRSRNRIFNFEVKTTIRSAGELIRQIRMYQEYEPGMYIIVCPDSKFEKVLSAQGIGFFKCPESYKQS